MFFTTLHVIVMVLLLIQAVWEIRRTKARLPDSMTVGSVMVGVCWLVTIFMIWPLGLAMFIHGVFEQMREI